MVQQFRVIVRAPWSLVIFANDQDDTLNISKSFGPYDEKTHLGTTVLGEFYGRWL